MYNTKQAMCFGLAPCIGVTFPAFIPFPFWPFACLAFGFFVGSFIIPLLEDK